MTETKARDEKNNFFFERVETQSFDQYASDIVQIKDAFEKLKSLNGTPKDWRLKSPAPKTFSKP